MPYCTSCGEHFEGLGSHCAIHDPYYFHKTKDRYNDYAYDSTSHPDIKYRTGHTRHHHSKSHKSKSYDLYNNNADNYYSTDLLHNHNHHNNNDLALIPTSHTHSHPHSSPFALANLQAAASSFQRLTTNHSINAMTFNLYPNGTKSVSVTANKDREQCPSCKKWFPDRRRFEMHQWEFPSGCELHEVCFAREEEHFHGTTYRHDRCFVKGCLSIYRREGGWKGGVVETHVREWHWGQ